MDEQQLGEGSEQQNQGSFADRVNAAKSVIDLNQLANEPNLTNEKRALIMKKLEELR